MMYYNDLNKNYNFSSLDKNELFKLVQKMNDDNLERKNKKFAFLEELGDFKFYDLAKEVKAKVESSNNFNVLEILRTFPLFGNPTSID